MPLPTHDYDSGHRDYLSHLEPAELRWVRTKPFFAPPGPDVPLQLHVFAHAVSLLDLPLRAQILDAGCGTGWLSELLARCGYWVTGVDISAEKLAIARERIAGIPRPIGELIEPQAEFHALPVREIEWVDRFDAVVLYDAMHHFDSELETLRAIHRALVPGGLLFLREGVRPPAGSEAERAIVAEMHEFQTLEAWFEAGYLDDVLRRAGFAGIRRFFEVDRLLEVGDLRQAGRLFLRFLATRLRLRRPPSQCLLAVKPGLTDASELPFRAELSAGPWAREGSSWSAPLTVRNAGRSYWPPSGEFPFVEGAVTIGPYLGERAVELPRVLIPEGVPPGGRVEASVVVDAEAMRGHHTLSVDLVREGIGWFGDLGGKPLRLALS